MHHADNEQTDGRFFRDLKKVGKWSQAFWVFVIPIVILMLVTAVFWYLAQGQDMLVQASDSHGRVIAGGFAVVFMAYVMWYCARLRGMNRNELLRTLPTIERHMPKLLGFMVFTSMALGLAQMPSHGWFLRPWSHLVMLLVGAIPLAAAVYQIGRGIKWLRGAPDQQGDRPDVGLWQPWPAAFAVLAASLWMAFSGSHLLLAWRVLVLFLFSISVMYPWFVVLAGRIGRSEPDLPADHGPELPPASERGRKWLARWTLSCGVVLVGLTIIPGVWLNVQLAIFCAVAGQFVFTCYVVLAGQFSRRVVPGTTAKAAVPARNIVVRKWRGASKFISNTGDRFLESIDNRTEDRKQQPSGRSEASYFRIFNVVAFAGLLLFVFTCTSVGVAVALGGVAVVLLGLSMVMFILVGIQFASHHFGLNGFLVLIACALILGRWFEPHNVHTVPCAQRHQPDTPHLKLKAYLMQWVKEREAAILDGSTATYPVYFVLADGGASRSGYWVASVLGQLHDTTNGAFADHLFCLSGASGGSWGTGTYYAMLRHAREVNADPALRRNGHEQCGSGLTLPCQKILEQDFLSFTLAHMLGNDNLSLVFPFLGEYLWGDRARALERSLEYASERTGHPSLFTQPFEQLTGIDDPIVHMPILCINVTRSQDGMPGVISTLDMRGDTLDMRSDPFSARIDVLSRMAPEQDLPFSTAIAMGSRFPYVSPAGRMYNGRESSYFVDGGYFDNSGAGVIHEMVVAIEEILQEDTVLDPMIREKLSFHVIHISNSPRTPRTFGRISPLMNDLFSPVSTLIGSYGMQTDVNDARLERYLQHLPEDRGAYAEINLYRSEREMGPGITEASYTMNWVISDTTLRRMNHRLMDHHQLDSLMGDMLLRIQ